MGDDNHASAAAQRGAEFNDQPYCRNCGYNLHGCTESSKCPECGEPLVEVLVRHSYTGKRYASTRRIGNLPLVAIASGPYGTEKVGIPVGVIAIGDAPRGIIAIGGTPLGVIAIGGFARGLIAIGGLGIGGISLSGCSVGVLAVGGMAFGLYSFGGMAAYVIRGLGGLTFRIWPF